MTSTVRNILATPIRVRVRLNPWIGWVVLVMIIGGLISLPAYFLADPDSDINVPVLVPFLVPAWGITILFLVVQGRRSLRARRGRKILRIVEQAVRLNLPLATAVLESADSEILFVRRRLYSLHDRLSQGEPIGLAILHSVPEIPAATIEAISAADRVGRLPQVLRRIVRPVRANDHSPGELNSAYRLYAVLVLFIVVTSVVGIMMFYVLPRMTSILHNFRVKVPWTTATVIAVSESWVPAILAAVWALLFFLPRHTAIRDQLIWRIPLIGVGARTGAMAEFCGFTADALEAGQPLEEALTEAARAQSNAVLKRRIRAWAAALAAGRPLPESARDAGLPPLVCGMLSTVRGGDDLFQVMSFLARHYESRFTRTREVLEAAYIPLTVCLIGSVVMFIALALFQPMVALIAAASPNVGGF
jgi:type II secretory pathway component PulF